jgi:hypothetical protein
MLKLSPLQMWRLGVASNTVKLWWAKLAMQPPPAKLAILLVCLVLLALMSGCATSSTPPSVGPRNPQKPQPSQSQPSEDYLTRVERNIRLWEQRLLDMRRIP